MSNLKVCGVIKRDLVSNTEETDFAYGELTKVVEDLEVDKLTGVYVYELLPSAKFAYRGIPFFTRFSREEMTKAFESWVRYNCDVEPLDIN